MKWRFVYLFLFLLAWGVDTSAEDSWGVKKTDKGTVKYKKETNYKFEGSELEGKVQTPSGAFVSKRAKAKLNQLMKVRTDFDEEVNDSSAATR